MKVIMTGGGTGGHIYPAIAIADRIMERNNNPEILFVGTEKGLEKELVPKSGYNMKFITVSGISRKHLLRNFKVAREYIAAKRQAKKIIRDFQPDIIIGTGGYVCGPMVKAGAEMGVKTFIHEQNAFPGLTNKMLERCVDKVFLGFEAAGKIFKKPEKHIVSGNPVRDEFFKIRKNVAREKLGIDENDFVLLAFGGSQGAGRLNKAMMKIVAKYSNVEKITVLFATGKAYYRPILTEFEETGIHPGENIRILEYIDHMEHYLSAADLVISRSGALAVSEISVCGVPSILIPSPNVTGNHQMFNARVLVEREGAILMEEKDLNGDRLYELIDDIKKDEKKLHQMSLNTKECAPLDASDIIYYNITS